MRKARTKPKAGIKEYDHPKHVADQTKLAEAFVETKVLKKKLYYMQQNLEKEKQYLIEMPADHLHFCYEYVFGEPGVAGNARKCYQKAIAGEGSCVYAKTFLESKHIQVKIKELMENKSDEIIGKRIRIEETLFGIMEECSKSVHKDRFGAKIMPSAMRSVAIGAAKELNNMLGLNAATETKLTSDSGNGIVFNVIVPEAKSTE